MLSIKPKACSERCSEEEGFLTGRGSLSFSGHASTQFQYRRASTMATGTRNEPTV